MKMRKLLAGAVAASLAVTSLATVASADETKTFWVAGGTTKASFSGITLEATIGASGTQADDTTLVVSGELGGDQVGQGWGAQWTDVVFSSVVLKLTGTETDDSDSITKDYTFAPVSGKDGKEFYLKVITGEDAIVSVGNTLNVSDFYNVTKAQLVVSGDAYYSEGSYTTGDPAILHPLDLTIEQGGSGDDISAIIAEKFGVKYDDITTTVGTESNYAKLYQTAIIDNGKWVANHKTPGAETEKKVFLNFNKTTHLSGMAQQVAGFFNGYEAGEIVLQLNPNSAASNAIKQWAWNTSDLTANHDVIFTDDTTVISTDFALAFNVDETGSSVLVTKAKIDTEALTVTFDISEILAAMKGNVKGNLHNVCYALTGELLEKLGATYFEVTGVTFNAFDTVEEDVEADVDVEDDDADAEIEDDDATVEEDDDVVEDDDAAIEDDTTEEDDDANVEGDVIDTPVVEDDDANPGTGVALAVVPAMVAAAAVVLSKKRK